MSKFKISDNTTTTTYTYDHAGNRLRRAVTAGGTTTTTIYVAGMEIQKVGSTETQRTVYYASGGAFRIIGGANAGLYFRHTDHLGSTSVLSNSSGARVANSDIVYAPFGEIRTGSLPTLTDFGYTGQRHDGSTGGLMYYGARYYLPGLRRFISSDTIIPGAGSPQAFNRYAYALNRPISLIDPTGHFVCQAGMEKEECNYIANAQPNAGPMIYGGGNQTSATPPPNPLRPSVENYNPRPPVTTPGPTPTTTEPPPSGNPPGGEPGDTGDYKPPCLSGPECAMDFDAQLRGCLMLGATYPSQCRNNSMRTVCFPGGRLWRGCGPDYFTLTVTGGSFLQGGFAPTVDRYGNIYLAPVGGAGYSPLILDYSATLSAGYLVGGSRSEEEMQAALSGGGINPTVTLGPIGINLPHSLSLSNLFQGGPILEYSAAEYVIGEPGASVLYSHNFLFVQLGFSPNNCK